MPSEPAYDALLSKEKYITEVECLKWDITRSEIEAMSLVWNDVKALLDKMNEEVGQFIGQDGKRLSLDISIKLIDLMFETDELMICRNELVSIIKKKALGILEEYPQDFNKKLDEYHRSRDEAREKIKLLSKDTRTLVKQSQSDYGEVLMR